MKLDVTDFLTKEHKSMVQDKITEAIEQLDIDDITSTLKEAILNAIEEVDFDYELRQELDMSDLAATIMDKLLNAIR